MPQIAFYDPEGYNSAATIRDNLLFGRVRHGVPQAEARVHERLRSLLGELGLEPIVNRVGLDHDVGPGGKQLFAPQRASIALARCLIARPDILILDGALSPFGPREAKAILARVAAAMEGRTLIATLADAGDAALFDQVLLFEGARYTGTMKAEHRSAA